MKEVKVTIRVQKIGGGLLSTIELANSKISMTLDKDCFKTLKTLKKEIGALAPIIMAKWDIANERKSRTEK